jgi:hypothetical protein
MSSTAQMRTRPYRSTSALQTDDLCGGEVAIPPGPRDLFRGNAHRGQAPRRLSFLARLSAAQAADAAVVAKKLSPASPRRVPTLPRVRFLDGSGS